MEYLNLVTFERLLTITTDSRSSIAFHKTLRRATEGNTLQVFIVAFRDTYETQVIISDY